VLKTTPLVWSWVIGQDDPGSSPGEQIASVCNVLIIVPGIKLFVALSQF
jgi:hypothetical protein